MLAEAYIDRGEWEQALGHVATGPALKRARSIFEELGAERDLAEVQEVPR
jgi:hypothetical protein